MLRGSLVLFAGLLLAGSGCARGRGAATDGRLTAAETVRLNVTNRYGLPMEVYANSAGITHRLGLVSPGIARDFVLPQVLLGGRPVEFTAQPSGGGPIARSGRLTISPGDIVDFEITSYLFDSRAVVRP